MSFQTVRASLGKSTTTGLYLHRSISAPRRGLGRGARASRATGPGEGEGEGRQGRGSHLGRVAEEAKSEAAAFELHLQGGAPGHGDPAPVVSREHADCLTPLPTGCVPRAAWLRLVSSAAVSRRPLARAAGKLSRPGSQTPPPETTPGPGRARHPPPPPPEARPARPVLGRQAGLARQPDSQAPYTSRALRGRTIR